MLDVRRRGRFHAPRDHRAIFTHRITRVVDHEGAVWIETKGDANAAPDPSISPATSVIGRVAVAIPAAGYLIALLSSPPGIVFVMLLGLLLLFAGWMLDSSGLGRRRSPADRSVRDDVPKHGESAAPRATSA